MRRSPERRQLLSVKSMMRYRPPKGTAGLALSAVNGCRREPMPPARMMQIVFSGVRPSIKVTTIEDRRFYFWIQMISDADRTGISPFEDYSSLVARDRESGGGRRTDRQGLT